MFGKKKQEKNVSNKNETQASDMTSGSKSTKSCGAKTNSKTCCKESSSTAKAGNTTKTAKACGGKCKTTKTKSCS